MPIDSRKQALRCLRWYTLRWRIEEWHRVLKSGCRIELHQHHSAERLARAIAIDAVIAWRVMLLTLLGREVPEIPCKMIFAPWECTLLKLLQPLVAPETMRGPKKGAGLAGDASRRGFIARLGGALNRNSYEPPGPQTILRGLKRFHDIGLGFMLRAGKSVDAIVINKLAGHAQG